MVDSLFKYNIDYLNETYCIIRDEERLKDYKSYIESLWQIYCPYSDKDFPIELAHDFDARFREMYLTCTLISKSFPVVPKKGISEGPDIATVDSTRKVFIEAVTCDEGAPTNRDRVPKLPVYDINTLGIAKASIIPENEILLRYTGKIFDKYKGYINYLEKRIVSASDSYIIALNSCKIRQAILSDGVGGNSLPLIVKAVLPVGDEEVTISKMLGSIVDWHYTYRPNITRVSESDVPTDLFLNDGYVGISGVLYSHTHIWDIFTRHIEPGDDLIFVRNPKATVNAVPTEYFRFGIEYIIDTKEDSFSIRSNDWREIR